MQTSGPGIFLVANCAIFEKQPFANCKYFFISFAEKITNCYPIKCITHQEYIVHVLVTATGLRDMTTTYSAHILFFFHKNHFYSSKLWYYSRHVNRFVLNQI